MPPRRRAAATATLASCLALALGAGAQGAECNGDECQGPPPAPEEVIPGTAVVEGPANPPVRFPKAGHKKPKHKKPHHKHHRGAKAGKG